MTFISRIEQSPVLHASIHVQTPSSLKSLGIATELNPHTQPYAPYVLHWVLLLALVLPNSLFLAFYEVSEQRGNRPALAQP